MAKTTILPDEEATEESIPIVTIPSQKFTKSYSGSTFLIIAILIAEAIAAYTIVALNYPAIYRMVYGHAPGLGVMYEIKDITINPAESKGQRFLVMSVGLQVRSDKDVQDVVRREIVIRDAIIAILSKKTVDQLADINIRNDLKQELGVAINQILDKPSVRNLFFTQYVMQ
jgi:flagellar basal body-associated protein FliL